jgi:hypothetical protein
VASTSCWLGGLAEPCNSVCYIARTAHNAAWADVQIRASVTSSMGPLRALTLFSPVGT